MFSKMCLCRPSMPTVGVRLQARSIGSNLRPKRLFAQAIRKFHASSSDSYRRFSTVTAASLTSKAHDLDYFGRSSFRFFFYPRGSIPPFLASIVMITVGSLLVLSNELQSGSNDDDAVVDCDMMSRREGSGNVIETILSHRRNARLQNCSCAASTAGSSMSEQQQQQRRRQLLRSRQTVRKMEEDSSSELLEDRYHVNWKQPLGEGSFGVVYLGIDKKSGERVAVKKISKKYTGAHDLQREMHALLYLRDAGGHPNICSLRENFSENGYYYLILDLIEGCEMFDHLVSQGAYSEADAARLVREVASALAFLHGGPGLVHCDLKPENLMLSSRNPSDAVIKLIDFGCAVVIGDNDDAEESSEEISLSLGRTIAYCPPELLSRRQTECAPSMDMWALGVIIFIMLTGMHPFDLTGKATDEEVSEAIISGKNPPLRDSPITAHLSDSAIDLIGRLMQYDPRKRLTADQMLDHPWTRGETANQEVMLDSDKKLSLYRMYKSGIAEKVFQNIISWSDEHDSDDVSRRTSLIERSFRSFDPQRKGYLTRKDLQVFVPKPSPSSSLTVVEADDKDSSRLSLSGFSELLAENMKNLYFPKGSVIYREGEQGNSMYFINSGTISVETLGSVVKRGPGDFFGEGALLNPSKKRSATIKCDTPVHAMEISREYFEKYLAKSDSGLLLTLREKDNIRKRNRSKMIIRSQPNLIKRTYSKDEVIFERGDSGNFSLFLVESGNVNITENGKHVFTATPSNLFGEHSVIFGRPRNCSAHCADECAILEMKGRDFHRLARRAPDIMTSIRNLSLRRDFKKAVVHRLKKEFPYDNPREAFDAVKLDKNRQNLNVEDVTQLMRELNPNYTKAEILEIIRVLALTKSDDVSFDEFKKVFIADVRLSASV